MDPIIAALRFQPLLPLWLLAGLGLLAAVAMVPALLRRASGAVLRGVAFLVLLLWLAGPRLVQETRQGLPDIGLLLVDRTASMQIGDRAALAEQARIKLEQVATRLPGLELRTVGLPEGGSAGTPLIGAITRALSDIPRRRLAGIVAITDGQAHDVPADGAAPWGSAPFHVLIPAKGEETDRRLRIVEAPSFGLVGHRVDLRYVVEDLGVAHPGGAVRVTIRQDGQPPQVASVPIGRPQTIPVPITRAGPTAVELQVETLPGEVSTLNNRAVVEINGVRDRLRVLLVSGEPHPGERTWRRLLKADPAVDLVHFTILRPPEKDDLTPLNELALIAFPVSELFQIKIRQFDLIILDRFQNRGILPAAYLRNIAEYVRNGGALLMSAGPEFASITSLASTPLGEVLPAVPPDIDEATVEGPFRPLISAAGTRHPVTANLPGWQANGPPRWGEWYRRIEVGDARGEVVMQTGDGRPLLILDRVGKGRVALLLSDQIWLWSRGHEGGGPQAELLRRLAHWLMKEPELEENALSARVQDGRLLIRRRSLADGPPAAVTVTDPDGAPTRLTLTRVAPGEENAALAATKPGVWQVTDGSQTVFAAVGAANPKEFEDLRATATKLAPLVASSGGSVHWLDPAGVPELRLVEPDAATAGAGWIGLRRNHDHLVTGVASQTLLPPWLALPLMLGFMLAAWRREGR